jgi:antitoxin (DNA-binding transcriptional repressor) of toxin-antitoxin stability system
MEKPVSAADATREFSRLLQDVKKGHSYSVTSHRKPLAKDCAGWGTQSFRGEGANRACRATASRAHREDRPLDA